MPPHPVVSGKFVDLLEKGLLDPREARTTETPMSHWHW